MLRGWWSLVAAIGNFAVSSPHWKLNNARAVCVRTKETVLTVADAALQTGGVCTYADVLLL